MVCLKCLAGCCVKLLEDSVEETSSKTTWMNVWLATLRTCSSHALHDASFQLLEVMVKVLQYFCDLVEFFLKELVKDICLFISTINIKPQYTCYKIWFLLFS